jgi:hypothetical protein
MTTLEEIVKDIRELKSKIEKLETQSEATNETDLKISFGAQITAKTNLLVIIEKQRLLFLEQQQRKFHQIFPLFLSIFSM